MDTKTLALYLGCEVLDSRKDYKYSGKYTLEIVRNDDTAIIRHKEYNGVVVTFEQQFHKLILRPLSSMTEEEVVELGWHERMGWESRWEGRGMPHVISPKEFLYFLSKGFDLFGLIERQEAIRLK